MATDFAVALRRFLTSYLAGLRGCSPATIASYRDTFRLLIAWFRDERSVPPARLALDHLDADAVTAFLAHLQEDRRNSVSTRNQRLAAISSFATWMQAEDPARMPCWQDILAIPAKKQDRPAVRTGMRLVETFGACERCIRVFIPGEASTILVLDLVPDALTREDRNHGPAEMQFEWPPHKEKTA